MDTPYKSFITVCKIFIYLYLFVSYNKYALYGKYSTFVCNENKETVHRNKIMNNKLCCGINKGPFQYNDMQCTFIMYLNFLLR